MRQLLRDGKLGSSNSPPLCGVASVADLAAFQDALYAMPAPASGTSGLPAALVVAIVGHRGRREGGGHGDWLGGSGAEEPSNKKEEEEEAAETLACVRVPCSLEKLLPSATADWERAAAAVAAAEAAAAATGKSTEVDGAEQDLAVRRRFVASVFYSLVGSTLSSATALEPARSQARPERGCWFESLGAAVSFALRGRAPPPPPPVPLSSSASEAPRSPAQEATAEERVWHWSTGLFGCRGRGWGVYWSAAGTWPLIGRRGRSRH